MMDEDRKKKVMAGLKCCSIGLFCPDEECPYEEDKEQGLQNCLSCLCNDALKLIQDYELGRALFAPTEEKEPAQAQLVPRELLLTTWGHGWQESHLIGDDEDPESFILVECVWINGYILDASGSNANAASDYWVENYGKRHGVRVWTGDEKPTDKQREETPWT